MKTVKLEDIYINTILLFCENLAELGCPKDVEDPCIWFREMSYDEQIVLIHKLFEIEERYSKMAEEN